jgi:hypothetical protein
VISDQLKDTLVDQIVKGLIGQGTDGIVPVLELLLNTAMKVEREQFLGAGAHERSEERKGVHPRSSSLFRVCLRFWFIAF